MSGERSLGWPLAFLVLAGSIALLLLLPLWQGVLASLGLAAAALLLRPWLARERAWMNVTALGLGTAAGISLALLILWVTWLLHMGPGARVALPLAAGCGVLAVALGLAAFTMSTRAPRWTGLASSTLVATAASLILLGVVAWELRGLWVDD